jgi:hypothetical protein
MNLKQSDLVMGAIKSAVGAATGVILANFVDVPQAIFSWPWFRHVLIATGMVVLVTEARFWNQWAASGKTTPVEDSIQTAEVATKQAGAAIAEVKTSVQNATVSQPKA